MTRKREASRTGITSPPTFQEERIPKSCSPTAQVRSGTPRDDLRKSLGEPALIVKALPAAPPASNVPHQVTASSKDDEEHPSKVSRTILNLEAQSPVRPSDENDAQRSSVAEKASTMSHPTTAPVSYGRAMTPPRRTISPVLPWTRQTPLKSHDVSPDAIEIQEDVSSSNTNIALTMDANQETRQAISRAILTSNHPSDAQPARAPPNQEEQQVPTG